MKAVLMTTAAAVALVAIAGVASVTANAAGHATLVPEKVADFELTDTSRLAHKLSYFK